MLCTRRNHQGQEEKISNGKTTQGEKVQLRYENIVLEEAAAQEISIIEKA